MNLRSLFTSIISGVLISGLVINGGAALASTKPTGESALARLAHDMEPGEWAELKAKRPDSLMTVFAGYRESGKGMWYHIAGWTDDGKWDPKTGQFLFMGFRKQNKFIAYSEDSNEWRVLPGPFGWNTSEPGTFEDTRKTGYGHVYGRNALDTENGIFYVSLAGYTYAYNVQEGTWTRIRGGSSMSIEYFPGLGLLAHKKRPGKSKEEFPLTLLKPQSSTWEPFTTLPFSGYHAFARYNPMLDEMIFIAGNDSRAVVTLTRNGQLTRQEDLPFDMTIKNGQVVVDPNTGLYLIFHLDPRSLYEFNSQTNRYRRVHDFRSPWGPYEMPVPAAIPELGVILFVDDKTLLYKHRPSKD
jgi:hypothetical protein